MTTIVEFPERRVVAEEAAQWLIRLDADTPPTRDELAALGEWLRRSAVHREELEKLAALWGRMNVLTELAVPLGNSGQRATRARLEWSKRPIWRWAGLVAAPVAVALALGWLLFVRTAQDPQLATNGLYATAVGQQREAELADGSQVILNTNSQIKVDYDAGYRRVHLLQGEALFTVAKDPSRPFRVYAGQGRIEAVGTAFSVHLDGTNVSVMVAEGRVSLASLSPVRASTVRPSAISSGASNDAAMDSLGTLAAGRTATIHSPQDDGVAGGVSTLEAIETIPPEELAQRLAWREGVLMFSGETLEDVVKEFGRYTTLTIEIPDAAVRKMRIGGRFPVAETETMLETLQANFNLRVTWLGHNRVMITAAGQ